MWLSRKNIPFEQSMLKPQLHKIIEMNKPTFKCCVLNEVLEKEGHDVLHLPLYYPDLNPVELIWAELKKLCCELQCLIQHYGSEEVMQGEIFKDGAQGLDSKVQACKENRRWICVTRTTDNVMDSFVIHLSDSESEESEELDSDNCDSLSGIEELS